MVLGADTMVELDGRMLGKPHTEQEAVDMLLSLQGRTHLVRTGVWVIRTDADGAAVKQDGFTDTAQVRFFPFDRQEAEAYVATVSRWTRPVPTVSRGTVCAWWKRCAEIFIQLWDFLVAACCAFWRVSEAKRHKTRKSFRNLHFSVEIFFQPVYND